MRDYGKVSPQFWTGRTGRQIRALGPEAQLVALYLMTAPGASMWGIYYLPIPTLAHETGLPFEGASKGLRCLSEAGFAEYDAANEVVWVREMAAHQVADSLSPKDMRHKAMVKELEKLAYSSVFAGWLARYGGPFNVPKGSPFEAPSKPLRSQEQEQEQEKEKSEPVAGSLRDRPTDGGQARSGLSEADAAELIALRAEKAAAIEAARVAEETARRIAAEKDEARRAKNRAKAKAREENPPPFAIGAAFEAIASTAGGRFAPGLEADWGGGIRISVAKLIRAYPTLAEWQRLGRWLAAGGDAFRKVLGPSWAASTACADAMARSREWSAAGEGPVGDPTKSGVHSVPMPPRYSREAPPAAIPPPKLSLPGTLAVDQPAMTRDQVTAAAKKLRAEMFAGVNRG